MKEHLIKWLEADKQIAEINIKIAELQKEKALYERSTEEASIAISDEMSANGVIEDIIEGELINYKLYFTTPRMTVKVDAAAVPDEFCKIERVPKKKEIKEFLEAGNQVNWASLERGASNLSYKAVKK